MPPRPAFRELGIAPGYRLDTDALFHMAVLHSAERFGLFAEDGNHYSEVGHLVAGEELARVILGEIQVMGRHPCY